MTDDIEQPGTEPAGEAELRRQLAEARSQLAMERDRSGRTEGQLQELQLRTMSETERRLLAQEQAIDAAIGASEGERQALKGQIAALMKEGNFDEAAELQLKIADSAALLRQQKLQKDAIIAQREASRAQPAPQAQPQRQTGTPRDVFDVNRCSPATRAWIEKHPQFLDDWSVYHRATAADSLSQAEGIERDTPEYFRFVEAHLGTAPARGPTEAEGGQPAGFAPAPASQAGGDVDYAVSQPQSRAAGPGSIAAAPSRTVPGAQTQRPRGVPQLSSDEREIADALYGHLTPADRYVKYAENRDFMRGRKAMAN